MRAAGDQPRVALVTGGGRGIGRAVAARLTEQGLTVMATSRTESDLVALRDAVGAGYAVGDVSTQEGCAAVVDEALQRHGRVDVLVSNAGADSGLEREIWEQDPDLWRESVAVNLDATFHLMRLVTRGMVARRWGRVIAVSSTAGQVGGPRLSAYCAAKHGQIGLIRAAAHDLAPHGVTCNAVCPGWVRTRLSEMTTAVESARTGQPVDDLWREREQESPAGRLVTTEEVAETVAFLASDRASGINGETVTVSLGSLW